MPSAAFIDDSRNFLEEETGKAKTITANIFNTILKSELFSNKEIDCYNCNIDDCDGNCISKIDEKAPMDLSIEELQKLINYKTKKLQLSLLVVFRNGLPRIIKKVLR